MSSSRSLSVLFGVLALTAACDNAAIESGAPRGGTGAPATGAAGSPGVAAEAVEAAPRTGTSLTESTPAASAAPSATASAGRAAVPAAGSGAAGAPAANSSSSAGSAGAAAPASDPNAMMPEIDLSKILPPLSTPETRIPAPNNPSECPDTAPEDPFGDWLGLPIYVECNYGTYACVCDWYHWLCAG